MSDDLHHANHSYKRAKIMPTRNRLFMMHTEESLVTAANNITLTDPHSIEPAFSPQLNRHLEQFSIGLNQLFLLPKNVILLCHPSGKACSITYRSLMTSSPKRIT
jgi:hypothetical protein